MDYDELEFYVSQPRLNRFLRACNNSKLKTQKLYKINLQAAQAFYPLMSLFETFFRNALNYRLSQYFNDPDWIINQKYGFMSDPSLGSSYFLKSCIENAENNIRRDRRAVTSSKILAEQTLGFWTTFFDNHHYILTHGTALGAFPKKPLNINRSQMAKKLKRIRDFRNRIYHNEPICFNEQAVDFSIAFEVENDIHEIMEWINPNLKNYTNYFNTISAVIDKINEL